MPGGVSWAMLARLCLGVVPAAFLGARANALLPAPVIVLAVAALTLSVGVHQLWSRGGRGGDRELGTAALVVIGAVVGFGSALTGTGGPVLLVPILLVLGVAPLRAVAVSQVAQLPVVVSGSLGYLQAGLTDVRLGTVLGIVAAVGTALGAVVATRIPVELLRRIVALACIAAGRCWWSAPWPPSPDQEAFTGFHWKPRRGHFGDLPACLSSTVRTTSAPGWRRRRSRRGRWGGARAHVAEQQACQQPAHERAGEPDHEELAPAEPAPADEQADHPAGREARR